MFEDLLSSYLMEGNRLEEIRKYKATVVWHFRLIRLYALDR